MTPDLYTGSLADLRSIDFRSPARDVWADESAVWARFVDAPAGLDAAAWALSGASRSDAGGPDWSLADHLAHVGAWQEIGARYIAEAGRSGRWPRDEEFEGGDFDAFNERLRGGGWQLAPGALRGRLEAARAAALAEARRLPLETVRGRDA